MCSVRCRMRRNQRCQPCQPRGLLQMRGHSWSRPCQKRRFSRRRIWPGSRAAALAFASGPMVSEAKIHIHADSSLRRFATRSEGQLAEGLLPGFTGDVGFILALFYLLFHVAFKGGSRLAQVGACDDGSAVVRRSWRMVGRAALIRLSLVISPVTLSGER